MHGWNLPRRAATAVRTRWANPEDHDVTRFSRTALEPLLFLLVAVVGVAVGHYIPDLATGLTAGNEQEQVATQTVEAPPVDPRYQHLQGLINELRARDIVIVTSWTEGEVGRPVAAQVLAGPVSEGRVRIGDEELSITDAPGELLEIRELLANELDITHGPTLVMDTREDRNTSDAPEIRQSWDQLSALARDLNLNLTICGIENFEDESPNSAQPQSPASVPNRLTL